MSISLEFFPPNDGNYAKVVGVYKKLSFLEPEFVSVTYGALGNAQNKSFDLISVLNENKIITAAHLTLANKSIDDIEKIVNQLIKKGINKIVALRGDCPNTKYKEHPAGFSSTSEFVNFLFQKGLEVCVSSYPEPHPDSDSFESDLSLLKDKQNAGASKAITQFCFSKDAFAKLIDESSKNGINIEITPGIMPIYNIKNILNMSQRCGINIPENIKNKFGDDENENFKHSIQICHEQLDYLKELGYKSFHFYTLNRYKFIQKLFILHEKIKLIIDKKKIESSDKLSKFINTYLKKLERNLSNFQYNVIIANIHEAYSFFLELTKENQNFSNLKNDYIKFLVSISPVIPHFSSECLSQLNTSQILWPHIDEKFLLEENVNIVVQFNGKKRGIYETKKDISEESLIEEILQNKLFEKYFKGNKIKKHIYINNRLINFII